MRSPSGYTDSELLEITIKVLTELKKRGILNETKANS